jgi:ATP-independent RNA helicase DbpA
MTGTPFSELDLGPEWLEMLETIGYHAMTPIQAESLPHLLDGRDLIGQANTGTGKTAAFGLGLLQRITPAGRLPGALVLAPTRELAEQIAEELRRLAWALPNTNVITACGGRPTRNEQVALDNGVDVVVGTPGRVLDHLRTGYLVMSKVLTVVLDEADRMLDMGFVDDVEEIIGHTPDRRQTVLMSATMGDELREVSQRIQRDPVFVSVVDETSAPDIEQLVYDTAGTGRPEALRRILAHYDPVSAIVFCNERATCDVVARDLRSAGYSAAAMHGGLEQRQRDDVLEMFGNGSLRFLVATNVAARGIDISELDAVINYELPRDPTTYVHRIGRTGRAGEEGLAITLIEGDQHRRLSAYDDSLESARKRNPADLVARAEPRPARMRTIGIKAGRKAKLRPGDIVGAFTKDFGVPGDAIGNITIRDHISFVAVEREHFDDALQGMKKGRVKNRTFIAFELRVV